MGKKKGTQARRRALQDKPVSEPVQVPAYASIYDLEDDNHSRPRWFVGDDGVGRWRYYEGYGGANDEKAVFLQSINTEHPLWSSNVPRSTTALTSSFATFSDTMVSVPVDTWTVSNWPKRDTVTVVEEPTDMSDSAVRPSAVFAKLLCDYIEKVTIVARPNFFDEGRHGHKWSKDKLLMASLKPMFETVCEQFEDPCFNLSLSGQSIKRSSGGYPRSYFFAVYDLYTAFMDKSLLNPSTLNPSTLSPSTLSPSTLNPSAKPFTPGSVSLRRLTPEPVPSDLDDLMTRFNALVATSEPKCTVTQLSHGTLQEKPMPPTGMPHPRRPSASSKNSTLHVEEDYVNGLLNLIKKIDMLSGPVVMTESL
jgi:hypothetical protein